MTAAANRDSPEDPPRQLLPSSRLPATVHATAIAIGPVGVLLMGPSGACKSDLALRCLAQAPGPLCPHATYLIADDRVVLTAAGGLVLASAPETIRGLIEVRGVGILAVETRQQVPVGLVIRLTTEPQPRLPERPLETLELCGIAVACAALDPTEPSAALKVALLAAGHTLLTDLPRT